MNDYLDQGIKYYHAGQLRDSISWLEAAVAQCTEDQNLPTKLLAMSNLCEAYTRLGCYADAIKTASSLLATSREKQMKEYEVRAIGRLAMAVADTSLREHWVEIKTLLEEAIRTARDLRLTYWEIQNLETLGNCAARMGELELGLAYLQDALSTLNASVDVYEEHFFRTRIFQGLASLAKLHGDVVEALRYAETAVGVAQSNRHVSPQLVAAAYLTLAEIERFRGQRDRSLELAASVATQARRDRWPVQEQAAEFIMCQLYCELGYWPEAEISARRSLELACELSMKENEVLCLIELGRVLRTLGRYGDAFNCLNHAREFAIKRHYEDLIQLSEELIPSTTHEDPASAPKV